MWKVELINMTRAWDNEKTVSEVLETKSFFFLILLQYHNFMYNFYAEFYKKSTYLHHYHDLQITNYNTDQHCLQH